MNGLVTGALAGVAMYIVAGRHPEHGSPVYLALITMVAMAFSCMVAGISGTAIPLVLRKLGADPATASSIFLTTITDVVSMGTFLGPGHLAGDLICCVATCARLDSGDDGDALDSGGGAERPQMLCTAGFLLAGNSALPVPESGHVIRT